MRNDFELTNEQWERIRKHFPEEHIPDGRPGRKPIPTRHVLEAVLWILNTGAQWHMLPQSYPNYKTVHRRFQAWCCNEVLRRVLTDVANDLRDKGALDEEECFIDATFVMAKGGGSELFRRPRRADRAQPAEPVGKLCNREGIGVGIVEPLEDDEIRGDKERRATGSCREEQDGGARVHAAKKMNTRYFKCLNDFKGGHHRDRYEKRAKMFGRPTLTLSI